MKIVRDDKIRAWIKEARAAGHRDAETIVKYCLLMAGCRVRTEFPNLHVTEKILDEGPFIERKIVAKGGIKRAGICRG